jgi:solute carrier family 25 carnitine/acylcarnitine transporter 20/29
VLCLLQNAELPAYAVLGAAALGAFGYWLAIFPVDVIKSSMQTDSIIKGQRKYTDMVTAAKVRLFFPFFSLPY